MWLWFLLFFVLAFGLVVFLGAPYLPSFNKDIHRLIKLTGLKKGQKIADLGSGDGRLLIVSAKESIYATGYEINPILWLITKIRILPYRKFAKVKLRNFWHADLSNTDAVFVFLIEHFMPKLEKKLEAELKPGTTVISYVFELPNKKPFKTTKNSYIYKF